MTKSHNPKRHLPKISRIVLFRAIIRILEQRSCALSEPFTFLLNIFSLHFCYLIEENYLWKVKWTTWHERGTKCRKIWVPDRWSKPRTADGRSIPDWPTRTHEEQGHLTESKAYHLGDMPLNEFICNILLGSALSKSWIVISEVLILAECRTPVTYKLSCSSWVLVAQWK